MKNKYSVYNTATNLVSAVFNTPEEAKEYSATMNAAMKPQYQTYTVATLVFDTEV